MEDKDTSRDDIKKTSANDHSFCFCTCVDECLLTSSNSNSILVNCGATTHIINDITHFLSFDDSFNPNEHFIELADGSRTNNVAQKRGVACWKIRDDNGNVVEAELENALYIPSYPQNIFSVQAATLRGSSVNFNQD